MDYGEPSSGITLTTRPLIGRVFFWHVWSKNCQHLPRGIKEEDNHQEVRKNSPCTRAVFPDQNQYNRVTPILNYPPR